MKLLSSAFAAMVVILITLLLRQYSATEELRSNVSLIVKDRDSLRAELLKVKRQVAQLQRPISAPVEAASAKTVVAEPLRAPEPAATPGVTVSAPSGWWRNGRNPENYVVGVDSVQTWGGMPSAYVKSLGDVENSFGGMMQTTAAENYLGKRVRLNAWLKTEDANDGGGHLWLRIDGQERGQMLGFDNMDNRAVKGTADWQEASIVLDVPQGARSLAYGFFVQGKGKMWVNGQTLTEVGPEVPTTNMLKVLNSGPKTPTNLGFDPNRAN